MSSALHRWGCVAACLLLLLQLSVAEVHANDCAPCPDIPKHYEELGCVGHIIDGGCCPERFECPDLRSYDKLKCTFRGRTYEIGEQLQEDLNTDCSAGCRCIQSGERASFLCAEIECPEHFEERLDTDCVRQRSLNACCSPGKVCGPALEQLPECWQEGKRYVQGEPIDVADAPCYQCICGAGWNNATRAQDSDNKHCRRVSCGIELRNLNRIRSGCIPVYYGKNTCCPIEYRCPVDDDELMPYEGRTDASDDPNMQCTFEALKLQRGQQLKSKDKCIKCTCRNPPIVDCVRDPNC